MKANSSLDLDSIGQTDISPYRSSMTRCIFKKNIVQICRSLDDEVFII